MTTTTTSPALSWLRSGVFWLLIPLLWAGAYLPGLSSRPLRLEEGRRATPAREMMQTHNFIQPTLYGESYLNKPPLFFWAVAGTGALLGDPTLTHTAEWAVRLPSVLALLIGAYVIFAFAPGQLARATRALAVLLLWSLIVCLDKGTLGEIESFLSLLVFAAAVVWWRGYTPGVPHRLSAWLGTGVLLALAMLTKGPPAIVQFYLPLIIFLLWQRDWRRLFSRGHLACIVVFILPTAAWVWAIHLTDPVAFAATVGNWLRQMGIATALPVPATVAPTVANNLLDHYLNFPWEVLVMLLPWLPLAVMAMTRRIFTPGVEQPAAPDAVALRRFLTCAVAVSFVFFWLWPMARPRHMMAVCYPTAILAAIALVALARYYRRERVLPMLATVVVIILLTRGVVYSVVMARKAPSDQPRVIAEALLPAFPPGQRVYTLNTFRSGKADLAPDLYNIQFYLAHNLTGITRLDDLTIAQTPAVVLMLSADYQSLPTTPNLTYRPLAQIPLRNSSETLYAIEITTQPK